MHKNSVHTIVSTLLLTIALFSGQAWAATPSVSAGLFHTCAVRVSGAVQCWGRNNFGELGNGSNTDSSVPVLVNGIANAKAVSAGTYFTCAALDTREVKCWGYNRNGQLGNGNTTDSVVPVFVSDIANATSAATAGEMHACAALDTGEVKCWGGNRSGQLGNGGTADSGKPVAVLGIADAKAVSAGAFSTCAVLESGRIQCWGDNSYGKLGNGSELSSKIPVSVSGISDGIAVSTGNIQSCALLRNGTVQCWGHNGNGELGNGSTTRSLTPVTVSNIATATSISLRYGGACAVLSDGQVKCWGANAVGQLGSGNLTDSLVPVSVIGLSNVTSISAGPEASCAVTSGDAVQCWGRNLYGALGNSSTTSSSSPVQVRSSSGQGYLSLGGVSLRAPIVSVSPSESVPENSPFGINFPLVVNATSYKLFFRAIGGQYATKNSIAIQPGVQVNMPKDLDIFIVIRAYAGSQESASSNEIRLQTKRPEYSSISASIVGTDGLAVNNVVAINSEFSTVCTSTFSIGLAINNLICDVPYGSSGTLYLYKEGYVLVPSKINYSPLAPVAGIRIAASQQAEPVSDRSEQDSNCRWTTTATSTLMSVPNPNCSQKQAYALYLSQGRSYLNSQGAIWAAGLTKQSALTENWAKGLDAASATYSLFGSAKGMLSKSEEQIAAGAIDFVFDGFENVVAFGNLSNTPPVTNENELIVGLIGITFKVLKESVKNIASHLSVPKPDPIAVGIDLGKIGNSIVGAFAAGVYSDKIDAINISGDVLEEYFKHGMNLPAVCSKFKSLKCPLDLSGDLTELVVAIGASKGYSIRQTGFGEWNYDMPGIQQNVRFLDRIVGVGTARPYLSAKGAGSNSSKSIMAYVSPPLGDLNRLVNVYALLYKPQSGLYSIKETGVLSANGEIAPFGNKSIALDGRKDLLLFSNNDLRNYTDSGWSIIVAYGDDISDAIVNHKFLTVYSLLTGPNF